MRQDASRNNYITYGVRTLLGIAFVYALWSLSKNLIEFTQLDERLINAENEVSILKHQKETLQAEIEEVETAYYEEQAIRNRLGLIKPGEAVVIIPEEDLISATASATPNPVPIPQDKPVWQQWQDLFF